MFRDVTAQSLRRAETMQDVVEMMMCGADLIGFCTGILLEGYELMPKLLVELEEYMVAHGYKTPRDMRDIIVNAVRPASELTIHEGVARKIEPNLAAPCKTACPAHVPAFSYVQYVARGEFEKAYQAIVSKNPLQNVCGYVCNHACEDDCLRGEIDEAIRIREIKRFVLEKAEAAIEAARRTHVYAVGSMREVMEENAYLENPFHRPLGPESSPAVFAMFLLGLYVGRRGIFHDITKHMKLIRRVFWWGLPIGLVSMTVERILNATTGYAVFRDQQATLLPQLFGDVIFTYGSTVLALAYAAGITLLAQHDRGKRLLSPLGSAGRMALTVYISGSVLFGTLFYGFAFGNAFRLGPAAVMGYAVLFFAILVLFAVWWTNRFRFGPMEWLWRALTYLKFPPIRFQERSHVKD